MRSDYAAVDVLIRELGAVRLAARTATGPAADEHDAIEKMIGLASEAVDRVIDAPEDVALISHARHALDAAEQGIAALAGELERSRRLRAEAQGLSARAQELLLGAPRPLRT